MSYLRHFVVEGKFFGTVACEKELCHSEYHPPRSIAYFCPKCAEVWARCPVEGTPNDNDWEVTSRVCRKHKESHWHTPGILDLPWKPGYFEGFPDPAVRWEFQRELEYHLSQLEGDGK